MIEFNIEGIKQEGYDAVTMVIIINTDRYSDVKGTEEKEIKEKDYTQILIALGTKELNKCAISFSKSVLNLLKYASSGTELKKPQNSLISEEKIRKRCNKTLVGI